MDGLGFWVGLVEDEFVGRWTLQPAHGPDQPDDPGVADLGYRLLQRHWRKGLASEGARELVRYGFDDVGLDRIIAQTITVNTGSRAVMERIGLRLLTIERRSGNRGQARKPRVRRSRTGEESGEEE